MKDTRPVERLSCVPSLIKWTGSKRSQAAAIARQMPEYERYFEPFLGGGALLYLAARPGSVAGDVYEPLVALCAWCKPIRIWSLRTTRGSGRPCRMTCRAITTGYGTGSIAGRVRSI